MSYVSNKLSAKDVKIKLNKGDLDIRHFRRGQALFAIVHGPLKKRKLNKGKVSWAV